MVPSSRPAGTPERGLSSVEASCGLRSPAQLAQLAPKTRCPHLAPPGAETARLEQEVEEARAEAADSW